MSQHATQRLTVEASNVGFVLIDAQPAFWSGMHGPAEPVMTRIEHALLLAKSFDIPVIATFEHPVERKGWLPSRLERVFPADGKRLIKHTFNCCAEQEIRTALENLDVPQLIVAGSETDVCVLQSVLGLLEMGFQVFLMEDAIFSSEPNSSPALRRMYQAGVTPITYKTLYYELTKTVDIKSLHRTWNEEFGEGEERYRAPEALPPLG